ncbi:MAG: hypothetical protein CVV42_15010 [Candidatus Riflebacteria bacterium HGW-Riflebacteria-2]|jgi:hypothetical protein|nr:MAG: hypothetical protein CVV42_15010 [Candidatus Riflebacteria bacterium HGW-Riflebacteria-2]
MEPADFAVRIEEVMAEECSSYECVLIDEDDIGRLWTFVIEDTFSGYLSVEDNEEGLKVRTVTVGLNLKDVTEASREELLELFTRNAALVSANFCVMKFPVAGDAEDEPLIVDEGEDVDYDNSDNEPEMHDMLIIQTRLPFEAFAPEDFGDFVQNLLFQADLQLSSQDDDDDGGLTDFDSDDEFEDDSEDDFDE